MIKQKTYHFDHICDGLQQGISTGESDILWLEALVIAHAEQHVDDPL